MQRSHVLLAGAAVVAALGALANHSGAERPSAEIRGSVLEGAAFANLDGTTKPATVGPGNSAPPTAKSLGEQLDLDRVALVGDHFEAPLADGRRAILTLDPNLQALAEKLLAESRAPKGAIVVMAPDGRILALAGRRSDDPKGSREGKLDWHLATEPWAPAASVFKLVTASALVAAGVDPDDKIPYHGGVRSVMESNLADNKRDSNSQSLTFGVAHSNNAILGKLAYQHLAPLKLVKLAKDLGLESTFEQVPGLAGKLAFPDTHDLEFAKAAAGFTGIELSALGGATLAATFADQGEQPTPRLIASIVSTVNGSSVTTAVTVAPPRRVLPVATARSVGKMMAQTCEGGSAAKSFHGRKVAGKTGTLTRKEPFYMEHSWFVGFAPVEKPELIVSVVFGNSENWHLRGQEAARRLIDRATSREKDRSAKVAKLKSDKRIQW